MGFGVIIAAVGVLAILESLFILLGRKGAENMLRKLLRKKGALARLAVYELIIGVILVVVGLLLKYA